MRKFTTISHSNQPQNSYSQSSVASMNLKRQKNQNKYLCFLPKQILIVYVTLQFIGKAQSINLVKCRGTIQNISRFSIILLFIA